MYSFAEKKNLRHEKSGITLASSGSASTLKRVSARYRRPQKIVIFEDGEEICA